MYEDNIKFSCLFFQQVRDINNNKYNINSNNNK